MDSHRNCNEVNGPVFPGAARLHFKSARSSDALIVSRIFGQSETVGESRVNVPTKYEKSSLLSCVPASAFQREPNRCIRRSQVSSGRNWTWNLPTRARSASTLESSQSAIARICPDSRPSMSIVRRRRSILPLVSSWCRSAIAQAATTAPKLNAKSRLEYATPLIIAEGPRICHAQRGERTQHHRSSHLPPWEQTHISRAKFAYSPARSRFQ